MHSRLYRNVLTQRPWVTSCTGYSNIFEETGLLGIMMSTSDPSKASELVAIICTCGFPPLTLWLSILTEAVGLGQEQQISSARLRAAAVMVSSSHRIRPAAYCNSSGASSCWQPQRWTSPSTTRTTCAKLQPTSLALVCRELEQLAASVTDEEVNRAKNMCEAAVHAALEVPSVVAEDIGRQMITYGRRVPVAEFQGKVQVWSTPPLDSPKRAARLRQGGVVSVSIISSDECVGFV